MVKEYSSSKITTGLSGFFPNIVLLFCSVLFEDSVSIGHSINYLGISTVQTLSFYPFHTTIIITYFLINFGVG